MLSVRLLLPGILGFRNRFLGLGGNRLRTWLTGGLALLFCVGVFYLSCRVLRYFQSIELIGDLLAKQLLSMVLLTFFSLLVFSHVVTALSNLYLSKDLELCHSLPVPLEDLFLSRAMLTFVDSSWMVMVFGLPVLAAYASVYGTGQAAFWLLLLPLLLGMALIAGAMGIGLTMLLVHIFPAQRTRDILVLLSILMVVSLYLLFRFLRPEQLVNPDAFFTVMQYMGALKTPDSPFLPPTWVRNILWSTLTGGGISATAFEFLLLWSTAAAFVVVDIRAAQRFYFKGFSKSQEAKKRRSGARRLLDLLVASVSSVTRGDLAALLGKDIRVFFRDNSQWPQLLLLGALIAVYVYNFSVLPLDMSPVRVDFLQHELAFLNMALAGFVVSAVSVRFVYTSISSEGEAYWILQASPMSVERYVWGKFALFACPILALAETLVLATNHLLQVSPWMMWLSGTTMLLMALVIVALALSFGAHYPRFRHANIAQVSSGIGGILFMIVSCLVIGGMVLLEAWPVYVLFMNRGRGLLLSTWQWTLVGLSFLGVVLLGLGVLVVSMRKAVRALDAYEG